MEQNRQLILSICTTRYAILFSMDKNNEQPYSLADFQNNAQPNQGAFQFDLEKDKAIIHNGETDTKKKKHPYTRYFKRLELVETDQEIPIQGQVLDPSDLFSLMGQLENEAIPKIIAIILDEKNKVLGVELVGIDKRPAEFNSAYLYQLHLLLRATQFIILVNHPDGDATPTPEDMALSQQIQMETTILRFPISLFDYVTTSGRNYWSKRLQEGTAFCSEREREMEE